MISFTRAYINVDCAIPTLSKRDSMQQLITAVAKAHPITTNSVVLYDEVNNIVYLKRTKQFIVEMTQNFISELSERFCLNENMANFFSLRQLNYLLRSFHKTKRKISCFSYIFLYVIFTLLDEPSIYGPCCLSYVNYINDIVKIFLAQNGDDEVALFLNDCFSIVNRAIENQRLDLTSEVFPAIPRRSAHKEK